MNCPHCRSAALSNAKFCRQCGQAVGNNCPKCGVLNPPDSKFCGDCGTELISVTKQHAPTHIEESPAKSTVANQGERRHLTVLFTDLTGYTRLMEKYDPEDMQALMATITQTCLQIIKSYNGHIERVLGDEILGLFGLPVAHEDDAIRAIKAAREIHDRVSAMQQASIYENESIAMHTGINTGLVVTAHPAPKGGTFDLSGDAVNLASRLSDMALPNQILVGPETYRQAFGFFDFDAMPEMDIKGKSLPISIYSVIDEKSRPRTGQRKLKLSAELVGRNAELYQLLNVMTELENGQGAIVSIVGEAGTGKSRLLQEFENQLKSKQINWITGHAFAHTQQVPYFPLVHLVRRWLELDGTATEEQMREGIAARVGELLGPDAEEIPIIQGLIGIDVQETAGMSPDAWRKRLQSAMLNLLSAIAKQSLTVFCMEDIHWGDAASFKLLKDIIFNFQHPAIVIYTSRPHASLFTSHEQELIKPIYREIRLGELTRSQAEDMMRSMLNVSSLPQNLCRLIHKRAEGNPFYLEEILNALVDSKALVFENKTWKLHRAFKESDIPSTIHGVIASRMDQLSVKEKRILQEAAVIGRAFLYDILKKITRHKNSVDSGLYRLERAGLIIPRSLHPEMEFMYKHALIQEVSYGSLLRSERQKIHERIGTTIENIYKDRLSEFDETLAVHFLKSTATIKAAGYLIRSGIKALRRCALDESNQYFVTAKSMLEKQHPKTPEIKKYLLNVIHQWAFVFYYKGLNRRLLKLLEDHLPLVDGLKDPVREGYHWAWHGCALWHRNRFADSYKSLQRALALGEKADHPYVIAYACTWLSWPTAELGLFDEAMEYCRRARKLYKEGRVKDSYIYFHSLTGIGYAAWHKGDVELTRKIGNRLVEYGKQHANIRSLVTGHCCLGWRYLIIGDIDRANGHFKAAIKTSTDPWYTQFPKLALSFGSISNGKIEDALPLLGQLIKFSDDNGAELVGEPARFFNEVTTIAKGQAEQGLAAMEGMLKKWKDAGFRLRWMTCGYVMAQVYYKQFQTVMQLTAKPESKPVRNLADKSITWFRDCAAEAKDMGSVAMHGQCLSGMGQVLADLGKMNQARQVLEQGAELLKRTGATLHLKRTKTLLNSLPSDDRAAP